MLSPTSQYSSAFHSFFNKEKTSAETATKLDLISSIWEDDHIRRLDEKNWQCLWCNQTCQEINATKALSHVLTKKGVHIKVFILLKTKLTQQDTKNFRITNMLVRVFYTNILKRLEHPSQVYRIIHLMPSNPPSIGVPKLSLYLMKLINL